MSNECEVNQLTSCIFLWLFKCYVCLVISRLLVKLFLITVFKTVINNCNVLTVLISSCVKEINVIPKVRTIHIGIFYTCLRGTGNTGIELCSCSTSSGIVALIFSWLCKYMLDWLPKCKIIFTKACIFTLLRSLV